MRFLATLAGALCATTATAHMQLNYPAPFNASNNPHRTTAYDPYLQFPYDCCGPHARWENPCRGYLTSLSTEDHFLSDPQGAPTAEWQAGSKQTWIISGIGNHYGGSCQVGFSIDQGKTFHVAASYEGNCPHRHGGPGPKGQEFGFTVPADMTNGTAIFAWTWYNREQEFNTNCAALTITAPAANAKVAVGFNDRPQMFVADDGNGCKTPKTTAELKYPNPGPDVVKGDGEYPLQLPTGNCDAVGDQSYHGTEHY